MPVSRSPVRLSRRAFVRWSAAAAGLAAATPFLAACQVMPGGGGKEKLSLWLDATFAPPSDDYQTEQINAWAAKNNVEVEITREPGENVLKKLQAGIESKQLPDISQANDARFAQFYPAKIFTDVSDLYQEVGKPWGGYYKPAEQLVTKDGKQWLLPYSLDSNLILYRKDILEAGGYKEAPKTWDEFFEIAQKLQKPPNLYGVGFQFNKAGTDSESTFTLMMYGFGASIVKEDGKTLNIKTPEMMNFANYVKKTYAMGVYPPGVTGWDNAGNNTALQDEKVIFIHNPASPLVWFRSNKPDMLPKIGVAAVPAGPKGQFNDAYIRDGFAIFDTGSDKRRNLAKDLLRLLYSKEVYRQWINLAFPSPAVQGMEDLEIWKNPQRRGFLEAAKSGVLRGWPGSYTPAYGEFWNRPGVLNMVIRLVVDNWSADQALDEMEKVAKDIWSKYA